MTKKRNIYLLFTIFIFIISCSNNPHPDPGNKKVLYAMMGSRINTLDPVKVSDSNSAELANQIYDSLYQYHYLKRPYKTIPSLAESLPEHEEKTVEVQKLFKKKGGTTVFKTVKEKHSFYTFRLKKGIHFQDDPCFINTHGKGREVTIDDFIYSLKRMADPNTESTGFWLIAGRIAGIDKFHKDCSQTKTPDYSKKISGIKKIDKYTVTLELFEPFPALPSVMTLTYFAPVPVEAVKYYNKGDIKGFNRHPVGTGAYKLKEWRKNELIVLERSKNFRDDYYPAEGNPEDYKNGLLKAAGKKLPFIDEIRITFVNASVPAWIYFLQGYRDNSGISQDNWNQTLTVDLNLTEEYKKKGISLKYIIEPATYFLNFNMKDSVVGTNKYLRQAISCALNIPRVNEIFYNNRLPIANQVIPPGVFGYDKNLTFKYKGPNFKKAKELLVKAGYPNGVDKNGKRLKIIYDTTGTSAKGKQLNLEMKNQIEKIGIKLKIVENTWPEQLKKMANGTMQMFEGGWILDYPDPENFLQLLYGKNIAPGPNHSNYINPEYDKLFEKMRYMTNSSERLKIIKKMNKIILEDLPMIPKFHSARYALYHSWNKNRKLHGITGNYMKYYDLDVKTRQQKIKEWNHPKYGYVIGFILLILIFIIPAALKKNKT